MTASARPKRLRLGRAWCEAIELADGRRLILRPMQASDAETLRTSFARLTPEEIRMRFQHPLKELTPGYAKRLATLDPRREFALVLVEAKPPEQALIGAVARASIDRDGREAEFAIIVGAEIAGQGLGSLLLGKLLEWARKKGLSALYGLVLRNNRPMRELAAKLGFSEREFEDDEDLIVVRRALKPPPAQGSC